MGAAAACKDVKLEIHVNFSCPYSPGTLLPYLSINAVNLSLRLKTAQEGKKVGKLGKSRTHCERLNFKNR